MPFYFNCHSFLFDLTNLFLSISMITGTGLITTNYADLKLSTQIITMLVSFGGSPLTVILPITLIIRKHCHVS